MLSPQIRNQVDALWNDFWSAGMTNPLTAIEQITYLLFLKRLQSLDDQRVRDRKKSIYVSENPAYKNETDAARRQRIERWLPFPEGRWDYIRQLSGAEQHEHISQRVFPWLRALDEVLQALQATEADVDAKRFGTHAGDGSAAINRMEDAYFQLPKGKETLLRNAIERIDKLFGQLENNAAGADLMGDIFEHLLSEIQTSGKNGQFRTPRHIIRFMVELLNPVPGKRLIDPAAGTCGFPINTIQYFRKLDTDPESLRLEWDGTAHRAYGGINEQRWLRSNLFVGYDNDRTMVRIGWMNMILHGLESPQVLLKDGLSKLLDAESGQYQYVLANPPFTGSVDAGDLGIIFPRSGKKPLTDKSELLFLFRILDLLDIGGRAAVIVPEGVLFGGTGAHKQLRKTLLLDHRVEGVISLPAGVFQPYTGVKTSILVFQKMRETGAPTASIDPETQQVWFYEVSADGLSLDARRNPTPEQNDLWDALWQWQHRETTANEHRLDYYKPTRFFDERWRLLDDDTLKVFPELEKQLSRDQAWSLNEMFGLPAAPATADATVLATQQPVLNALFERFANGYLKEILAAADKAAKNMESDEATQAARANASGLELQKRLRPLRTAVSSAAKQVFQTDGDNFAKKALDKALVQVDAYVLDCLHAGKLTGGPTYTPTNIEADIAALVREFAKLDGYNIKLRTREMAKREAPLAEAKCWTAPVRVWVGDEREFDEEGLPLLELLDPACIEANAYNLSAGRYKPVASVTASTDMPSVLIVKLISLHDGARKHLNDLLNLVEEKK